MSDVKDNLLKKNGRILYVDPNYAYRHISSDGNETVLTPPLEDLCISVNLTAYIQSRQKTKISGGASVIDDDNNKETITIGCVSNGSNPKEFTFLAGDKRYLTTYYTDISYQNYGTNKIVEGLGIENIQIGFESWYTPTVTIKFVDVRGSALYGNEEAIHNKKGELTADNVFGCFMTIPYPLFRLQVKGLLGRPVTYQLTCSDVKSEYNKDTGNFEMTVHFIGYSYGLLTDIPLNYIVCAPYMTYYGKEYWESKVNSPEWALDNGHPPIPLVEFYNKISGMMQSGITPKGEHSEESERISALQMEYDMLDDLKKLYDNMVQKFTKLFSAFYDSVEDDGSRQLFCFTKAASINFSEFRTAYHDFKAQHDAYNSNFSTTAIPESYLPNYGNGAGSVETQGGSDWFAVTDAFKIETEDGKRKSVKFHLLSGNVTVANIKKVAFGNVYLSEKNAQRLKDEGLSEPFDNKVEQYCLPLSLGKYGAIVVDRMNQLIEEQNNIKAQIEDSTENTFLQDLGWNPDIGNVFKIIMCHLETFIHVLMHAAETIIAQKSNGQRSLSHLGLGNIKKTDFLDGITELDPWPQITGPSMSNNNSSLKGNDENALAWLGDYSPDCVESEVVNGILEGILRMTTIKNGVTGKVPKQTCFPITPADMQLSSPFANTVSNNSVASLAAQLAERGSVLFGLMNDGDISDAMAKTLGKIDAYNYYMASNSSIIIDQDIFNSIGQGDLTDILIGIAMCNDGYSSYGQTNPDTGKTRYVFETDTPTAYGQPDRQPMIVEDGNKYKYTHYYLRDRSNTNKIISALPSHPSTNYTQNRTIIFDGGATPTCHEAEYIISLTNQSPVGLIHAGSSQNVINAKNKLDLTIDEDLYTNPAMFSIITKQEDVEYIVNCFENAKSGAIKIGNYESSEELIDFIKRYWKVYDSWLGYYEPSTSILSNIYSLKDDVLERSKGVMEKVCKNDNNVFNDVLNISSRYNITFDSSDSDEFQYTRIIKKGDEEIPFSSNEVKITGNNVIMCNGTDDGEYEVTSLLGHIFYYLQNNIEDITTRKRVKTLLFLQSFNWTTKHLDCFNDKNGNAGYEAVPYGYLLLLGGLLWRSRKLHDPANTKNDIIETECDDWSGKKLRRNNIEYTPYFNNENKSMASAIHSANSSFELISVSELFGHGKEKSGNSWWPDQNIMNQLINLFLKFVDEKYPIIQQYELTITENGKDKQCDATSFYRLAKNYGDLIEKYEGRNWSNVESKIKASMKNSFSQMWTKYGLAIPKKDPSYNGIALFYKENDQTIQTFVKDLYTRKVIVANLSGKRLENIASNKNTEITFSKSLYQSYLSSFTETLKDVVEANNSENVLTNTDGSNHSIDVRQFKIIIYYYCKSLWDKWLVSSKMNTYDVSTFFENNFVFIDSFYRNTYSMLPMNCETITNLYKQSNDTYSLFSYINDLVSKHRCMFFALPDYIGFKGDEGDDAMLRDMFKPIPYNEMNKTLEVSNKFVIIFTGKPSEHLYNNRASEYRWDGFDIYGAPDSDDTENPPVIFRSDAINNGVTSPDYHVPSFGVTLNNQNNTIFKGVVLNNTNPVQTEAAIYTLTNILSASAGGQGKVVFHGQDMYNIFSNYSYQAEIEMLGNAQIMPLMYFQLLNIPLWRGAYMIFNVQHNITPGNMITKFKGMKLCATPVPWATSYMSYFPTTDNGVYGYGGNWTGGSGAINLPSSYQKVEVAKNDHYHESSNRGSNVKDEVTWGGNTYKTDQRLIDMFNRLYEEIELLDEGWNIMVTHATRQKSTDQSMRGGNGTASTRTSQHCYGQAIDIQIKKNGKVLSSGSYMPEILKVFDMIFCLHNDVVGQILIEYKSNGITKFCSSDNSKYCFHVLHVGVQTSGHPYFEGQIMGNMGYDNFLKGRPKLFMDNVHPEINTTAYRTYKTSGALSVSKHFPQYGSVSADIDQYFKNAMTGGGEAFDRWWNWSCSWEGRKSDGSETYGWTHHAEEGYNKKYGNDSSDIKTKAYKSFWQDNNIDKIKDPEIAIMCMWICYWTGNPSIIKLALDGVEEVKDKNVYSRILGNSDVSASLPKGGKMTSTMIDSINSYSQPMILAKRIKYHAGKAIENAITSDGSQYAVKYSGHRRRWRSIGYKVLKNNNQVTDDREITDDILKSLWEETL